MERKSYKAPLALKADADDSGAFTAQFATLGVVDLDGDVTEPGAFEDGQETIIEAWNHGRNDLPVGRGVIHEVGDKAMIDGRFFLDTQSGREHYEVVKALGPLQEWSYTFNVLDAGEGKQGEKRVRLLRKLDVWGVAPVQRGAGVDTRTVNIKSPPWSAEEQQMLQRIHDLSVDLGAQCPGRAAEDEEGAEQDEAVESDGKSRPVAPSRLAARLALELIRAGAT